MAVSIRYVAEETGSNLFRNRMMAVAAVLTVAVSLSLVGVSLLLRQAASSQVSEWANNVSMDIFENAGNTQAQHAAVASMIAASPQIHSYKYLDHAESHQLMAQILHEELVAVNAVSVAQTPPLWQVVLVNPNAAATVADGFEGKPGIYAVNFPGQSIKTMEEFTGFAQKVLLGLAVVIMVASLVLILNAIRMAIFARRREVGVMKLVGATNWFIRIPFMLEGLVQGLIGSLVAAGVVLLTNDFGSNFIRHHVSALANLVVTSHDLVVTEVVILLVGTLMGAGASAIAVRRFLDV